MPTTISRLDVAAPPLGFGGAALSLPPRRLSVVASSLTFTAPPQGQPVGHQPVTLRAFVDPLDDLGAELQRIHGAADCADAYVFPA